MVAPKALAQLIHTPVMTRYLETGTYSRNFTDVFSVSSNQAALSLVTAPAAGVYSEKRYLMKELVAVKAVVATPFASGGVAITADYSGYTGYNESQLGLAYGRALGEAVGLGIAFNYQMVSIPGYGNASGLSIETGILMHVTEKLHTGFHLYRPAGGRLYKNGFQAPSVYTAGMGYEASGKLLISTLIVKTENQPVDLNVSLHYVFIKSFFIRAGIATSSGSFFAGTSLTWKTCRMDVAATYHPRLGVTPSILFIFHPVSTTDKDE